MSNNSKLFVPMYMEALALSKDKKDCVDLSPQLQQYTQSILGNVLQPNIKKEVTLKRGIHLHWTLPKALKHSFVDEGGEAKFPFAPNRWIVARIRTDKGLENMDCRLWIVRSDEKNAVKGRDAELNWITIHKDKLDLSNLGKTFEWSSAYDDAISESILTGVGAANPYFSSFYLSSKNVFGFHDDMEDIDSDCTLTYVVTGWYNNPADDPISPPDFDGEAKTNEQTGKERELDWFKQQWKYDGNEYPESCLLHSSIHSIQWNTELKSGVPDGEVQVYAGNTAVESLSAQIIKSNEIEKTGIEELLNALQYQFLEDNTNEPGLKAIQTEIHKRGFSPKNRSSFWEITRVEADDSQLESKNDSPYFPENNAISKELNELNEVQINSNKIKEEIISLQQEHYFLWYKQASKTVNGYDVADFDYNASREPILNQLVSRKIEIELLTTEVEQRVAALNTHKELSGKNAAFILRQKLEDRFWEPNDPVLLLCGSGIGNTEKPVFQSSDKEINCRVASQLLSKLYIKVPYNETTIPVTIFSSKITIPKVDELGSAKIPFKEIKTLVCETLLLDHSLSLDFALEAYKEAQLGEGKDKTSPAIKAFGKEVVKIQLKPQYEDNEKAHESFAITLWQQAWTPLFMVWDAVYTPDDSDIKNLDLVEYTDKWELQEGLYFNKHSTGANGQGVSISGISPFSNSVFANLKRTIPDSLVNKYGNLNLLAQSLSGLNKTLLMQRTDIQLPPFKYVSDEDYKFATEYLIDRDELNIIGDDGYKVGCNPGNIYGTDLNLFNPLRSGSLDIKNLSIVDVFGQVKKVITDKATNNPEIACAVMLKANQKDQGTTIPLPPRIVQPSRLKFSWLNAKDNLVYQDTGKIDNPIFGWLVPNYLDKNILIYDGEGNEVVVLQIASDVTKDEGLSLLKRPFPGGNVIPDLEDNLPLKKLLDALDSGSKVSGLMDLAYKIGLNALGSNAVQQNTSALLYGQPLALARCAIGLEVLGLPYYNQRWDRSGKEDIGFIDTVKFPLSIGDYSMEKDGLVGYFRDDDSDAFYMTTNAPDFNFSDIPFFRKNASLKMTLHQDPLKVSLLLNPSMGTHLSTGILPTKFIELFHSNSSRVLSQLNISFRVAPFIAEQVAPGIPIPTSISSNWKWTHKSDVMTWKNNEDLPEGKSKQISGFKKQQVYEGWLRLSNLKTNN
ncbi:hypothetical protein [Flavobacterium lipolyticum]|uniref:Uncharacterized protein n=1 Tax=Flavobacterium lipolyticum TaxID=2893754 RepID=A0ABS8M6Y5_9FLAO|nr:hypothetical protein [Flavobacterium sp. F-126]MCC9020464.1 hypothetical protein [Flavobacterium sp. F-126]